MQPDHTYNTVAINGILGLPHRYRSGKYECGRETMTAVESMSVASVLVYAYCKSLVLFGVLCEKVLTLA